jgi:hypothetical protein
MTRESHLPAPSSCSCGGIAPRLQKLIEERVELEQARRRALQPNPGLPTLDLWSHRRHVQ